MTLGELSDYQVPGLAEVLPAESEGTADKGRREVGLLVVKLETLLLVEAHVEACCSARLTAVEL